MRKILFALVIAALSLAVGCGGGGSSSSSSSSSGTSSTTTSTAGGNTIAASANNVAPLVVNSGPILSSPSANEAYTNVTICAPLTANCVTIDNVIVDTGSTGLRIPAGAFASFSNGSTVLAALQAESATPTAECVQFLDESYFWGSVRTADVKMGGSTNTGEVASSVPIHIMADSALASYPIPTTCSTVTEVNGTQTAGTEEDSVTALGANGLLGVGNFEYDCDVPGLPTEVGSNTFGIGNSNPCASSSTPPTGAYYTCSGSTCTPALASASQQVTNPVSFFTPDNNGVVVELPSVPATGAVNATGALVFGIGTQSNNAIGSGAVVLPLDTNYDDPAWLGVTTVYNGKSYPSSTASIGSFLDSGSNGIFFLDQPTSDITNCSDWYCPGSTENLTAVNESTNGDERGVAFSVANADELSGSYYAFSGLAGPNTDGTPDAATQAADGYFDWGMSFFFGRNVNVGIWGATLPSGVSASPYWAY